ncbi:MAG: 5-amino-6-(D-ribitylamino)uracil--L-tyrosine 4-hydroxyphenyl transferase CofH [Xanthobacteraceae bacterium]
MRERGHGRVVSYSRKVFIPLTRLCRDTCGYCAFATTPGKVAAPYLSPADVLAIAQAGRRAGCHEALFTLGDKPELRYPAARSALESLGYASTVDYLSAMCERVLTETGLLPHVNAGLMDDGELTRLRAVSVSQGLMLESTSERLCERGGPHFGCPDKVPAARLKMIEAAGKLRIPFTSGILIGIGETRQERVDSLLALRRLHERYGHVQEIIVQNFRAKPRTRMAGADEPDLDELLWTAAVARLMFGPSMNIQVPPNLSYDDFPRLLDAGINDWGGISPVTPDHVNPEARWPQIARLEAATAAAGLALVPRLAIYPPYVAASERWLDARVHTHVVRSADATGFARCEEWSPGIAQEQLPARERRIGPRGMDTVLARAVRGEPLAEQEIAGLFAARDSAVDDVCAAADDVRQSRIGGTVTYVVNRNINYTNVCLYRCAFCAFSKGKLSADLRGTPYDLSLEEVARRAAEAWERGATEVCMQGGINPHYTGETYLTLLRAVKSATPKMHVHAFSPLEISQGAATLGIGVSAFLEKLQAAGLGSLPGTAAEILDDEIRAIICPDKLGTQQWLDVIAAAHKLGLPTTSTIMFGHVEQPVHWARHLLALRTQQERTGGFSEFVPLPFVHMEAPIYLKGRARKGPTWREVRLMHAVGRLALHPLIVNIQASWVKLGEAGVAELLGAGVNDLGGTLMNESISRAAGTQHGQELAPPQMEALIGSSGRTPRQRTTLYRDVSTERRRTSFFAAPLAAPVQTPFAAHRQAVPAH